MFLVKNAMLLKYISILHKKSAQKSKMVHKKIWAKVALCCKHVTHQIGSNFLNQNLGKYQNTKFQE
jgi:hypothetical protein